MLGRRLYRMRRQSKAVSRVRLVLDDKSVTKYLSLGTGAFWLGQQRKSGVGFLARYDTKKMKEKMVQYVQGASFRAVHTVSHTGLIPTPATQAPSYPAAAPYILSCEHESQTGCTPKRLR